MHLSAIFLFVLSCIGATYGYSSLRRQIPNGYKVPHPCRPGTTWDAVGHMAPEYDPTKNAFGKDVREVLKDRQLEWAKVCNKDSDGDGLTNGQELGDPSCMWKVSDGLQGLADPMGHPGLGRRRPHKRTGARRPQLYVESQRWIAGAGGPYGASRHL
ncbi:hypothetical protein DPMN_024825 [Dreissena polymorpha]|uniref:Temptin Cys/Cys disulfide domain-containing protein n=1 Tax=Dreissena polymorpha TaxID=45954 RepID=A0A9D4RCQ5_DREPO|nr:hypothetical protein DPMN_024825 [Dreissena polymorpha]